MSIWNRNRKHPNSHGAMISIAPLLQFSGLSIKHFFLKRRIRLYRKIYRRNPHLWDITEYNPAYYYPYEAFELRSNPNLIVSYKVGIDLRRRYEPIEFKPHEAEDIHIVWDFFRRCVHRMNQVQAELSDGEIEGYARFLVLNDRSLFDD